LILNWGDRTNMMEQNSQMSMSKNVPVFFDSTAVTMKAKANVSSPVHQSAHGDALCHYARASGWAQAFWLHSDLSMKRRTKKRTKVNDNFLCSVEGDTG
jgi:hypothetical protein